MLLLNFFKKHRLKSKFFIYMYIIKLTFILRDKSKSKIFLIGTPVHGNLGDQAIVYAELKILKDYCKKYDVIEIPFNTVNYFMKFLIKTIKPQDIIVLMGGGNLGVEYFVEEDLRRKVISEYKNNKIIIFPQTIYFGDSKIASSEFDKTKSIYNSHKKLTLVAREDKSYEIMKKSFHKNKVILTPDIVLYLNQTGPQKSRKDILFCFRNDVESVLDLKFKQQIINELSLSNIVNIADTVVARGVNMSKRKIELESLWSLFSGSKLVITDRLHGMVFAAITATPCIVLSNYNHKVKGTYEWIKHLSYIKFVENPDNIIEHINDLLSLDPKELKYDNSFAMDYYNEILKVIYAPELSKKEMIKEKLV